MANDGPVCISVINMKGGVGKTTIAALLARYAAANLELRVLTVDLDPQANLSQVLLGQTGYMRFLDQQSPSIVDVFAGYHPPSSDVASPTMLNASSVVHTVVRDRLAIVPSRFDFSDNLIKAVSPNPRCLAQLIADSFQDVDLILIDCAPTESIFTRAAYHASRYVVVPVKPEFLATIGFPLLNDSLQAFRNENSGHQIDVLGIVINNATYDGGNFGGPEKLRAMSDIRTEAATNSWHVFENELDYSRGFPKMMRGDNAWLGNAQVIFWRFAREFFDRPELRGLSR